MLGKPHGVRGEIWLRLFNIEGSAPARAAPLRPGPVILARDAERITRVVTATRPFGAGLLLTIEGVDSREAAAALTLAEVRVAALSLPPLAPRRVLRRRRRRLRRRSTRTGRAWASVA